MCNMRTAAPDSGGPKGARRTTVSKTHHPSIASAVAAATSLPSPIVSVAASTDVAQRHLIEWAAPAPGWLLAFSSAAFFFLAFFAFSQYRKRMTRTLNSGENESGIGSSPSGPAITSLADVSAGRVPNSLFPALASRIVETYVSGSPRYPRSQCSGDYSKCHKINSLNCFPQPPTTSTSSADTATTSSTGSAVAGLFDAFSERFTASPDTKYSVGQNTARSAAGASATAATASSSPFVTGSLSHCGKDMRDAAADTTGVMYSQVSDTTNAPTCYAGVRLGAPNATGSAAADMSILEKSVRSTPLNAQTSSSSLCNKKSPRLSARVSQDTSPPASSDAYIECRSSAGYRLLRRDFAPVVEGRRTSVKRTATPYFFHYSPKRAAVGTHNRTAAIARFSAAIFSTSSLDQTSAGAVCDEAVPDWNGRTPRSAITHPACTSLAFSASTASSGNGVVRGTGVLCRNFPCVISSSSLGSLEDVNALPPPFRLQREVVLHGAVPSKNRRWRSPGRSPCRLVGHPRKSAELNLDTAPELKRSGEVVCVPTTHVRNGRAAEAAHSTTAVGARHRAVADDGRETDAGYLGRATGVTEEIGYASLAVAEDTPAPSCAGARTTFTFDGASMRSVILAIVTAAALLRALLLLLQLVANPLESKRSTPAAVTYLPTRSSSLSHSPKIVDNAITAVAKEWNHVNDDADALFLPSPHTNVALAGIPMFPDVSSISLGSQSRTDASLNSSLNSPAEAVRILPSAAAARILGQLGKADRSGAVASTEVTKANQDATFTRWSNYLHVPPSAPPLTTHGSSPLPKLYVNSDVAEEMDAAAPRHLFPEGTAASVMSLSSPGERSSFSSPKSLVHVSSLQIVPPPHSTFTSVISRRLSAQAETPAGRATTSAATAEIPRTLSFSAPAERVIRPLVSPGSHMLPSPLATVSPATGQVATVVYASATTHATSKPSDKASTERHGPLMVERRKAYIKAGEGVQEAGASDTFLTSRSSPQVIKTPPLRSSRDVYTSAFPRFKNSVHSSNSEDKNFSDSRLTLTYHNTSTEFTSHKGATSKRGERHRRTVAQRKNPPDSSTRSRPSRRTVKKLSTAKRSSNTSNMPPVSSRINTGAKGRRTGWPSALWLRTLARSLPPMLCIQAYALLVLFLLDLYYASSRLENVRWTAIGSYVFLAGMWILFTAVAGLTVAEDNTRREAAHLFARSICCLLGFCFTVLSVSLAVVGSLVLKQLTERKSTQLFFRPPMVVDQLLSTSDSPLQAVVASSVYRPPQPCLPSAHRHLQPFASGREYCLTHSDEKEQFKDAAGFDLGEDKPWLASYLKRYWSAVPEPAPVAAALSEEGRANYIDDDTTASLLPQHDFENQKRWGIQRLQRSSDLAWIERRRQQLAEQELYSRTPQTSPQETNQREGTHAPLWCFLSCLKRSVITFPGGLSSLTAYSTAGRRLLMLTLCCPPLLLMRGIHLVLVGAQIFPHYYPSFVEEKGTFDVIIYLVTEWLPLTLLTCASSHTITSKQRGNSLMAHATNLDDAYGTPFLPVQSHVLHLQSPFPHRS